VAGGTRFLGTFDRAEAVLREELEFFASGHPLVEGLLSELETVARRAALVELAGTGAAGSGCWRSWPTAARPGSRPGRSTVEAARTGHACSCPAPRAWPAQPEQWEDALPAGFDWPAFLGSLAGTLGASLEAVAGFRLRR